MYLPGLPELRRDLETGASQTQLTLSACLLGLACGQVVAGPLSDSLGRRRPLLVGLAGYALVSLLCAAAPSAPALVGLRFLQGCAGAAGIVIARAVVRDLHTGAAAARFFSMMMLVNGLAPILAPLVGGQLLRATDWRGVFVVLSLLGGILLLAAARGLGETLPADHRQSGGMRVMASGFRELLTDRRFVGYAGSAGCAFAAMFAYIAGSSFVLQQIYGVSPQAFSLAFAVNAIGIVITSQVNRRLISRRPLPSLLRLGLATNAVGGMALLAVVLADIGLVGVLPALFVVVASIGFVAPNAAALALASHPRSAGSASALLGVLQYAFGAAAAPLVGIAGEQTALPMAIVMAGFGIAGLIVFALLVRGAEPPA